MKLQLIKILAIQLVSITLCIAIRYDCDKRNVTCGCAFKHVEINEENNNPEEAIPYSWSMVVSIRYDCNRNGDMSTHCCGGTILNDRYILTAARCFDPTDNSSLLSGNITIAASVHSLSQNCQTIRVVDDIFIHPNWTTMDEAMHNIAILRLAEPLDFHTDFIISPACFPSRMNTAVEIMPNTKLAVVGWSVFSNSGNNTDQVLQQLIVYPIDYNDSLCARSVGDSELLFCAGRDGGLSNLFYN
jgi:secreted trypsin-like serine protease